MFADRSSRDVVGEPNARAVGSHSYLLIEESWRISAVRGRATLEELVSSPQAPLHINLERLVDVMSDAQRDSSPFGAWLFQEAARTLASICPDASLIDNNDFSHAAKYLFCGACFRPPSRSVLDNRESLHEATALVDRAVTFCESSQSLGTTPLIIRGIAVTNMRRWVEAGSLAEFYFKPSSLTSSAFLGLIRTQSMDEVARCLGSTSLRVTAPHRLNREFCEADSPAEFLLRAFEHNLTMPVPELHAALRELLVRHVAEGLSRYPFLTREVPSATGTYHSTDRIDFAPGYYFDVFGTLIDHDGTPNARLIQLITDLRAKSAASPVFLVSDSQPGEVAKALSFMPELPPLLYKEDLRSKELEFLIDASGPSGQGLHARQHLLPDQAVERMLALCSNQSRTISA
jgi:hypothetical protein